jgi:uncharacterized membrane protein YcaP (DUF421 family)
VDWTATLYGWLDRLFGLSSKAPDLGFGEISARAFVVYVALLVVVRSGKKRFLGEATAFDVILVITLGSIAARAISGNAAFFGSMLALAVLVATHWVFSALARESRFFSGLVKGHSTLLIRDGRINRKALRAAHMSDDDLEEDLRNKGIDDPTAVAEARLERNGKLSVIKKK